MRLLVSIVTYECDLNKLEEAVASLLKSDVKCYLRIVDNDSSGDYLVRMEAVINKVLQDASDEVRARIAITKAEKNGGFGYGHNIAFSNIPLDAEYWLVMNPDVVVQSHCLQNMLQYMDQNLDVGCVVPRVSFPNGDLQYLNKRLPSVFDLFIRRFIPTFLRNTVWIKRKMDAYEMRDVGYDAIIDVPFASGCFMLLRRSTIERVGAFDEKYFMYLEDCDLSRRIADVAAVRYLPDAQIIHHWERGSHKSMKLFMVMLGSMCHYFDKWGCKWL